MHDVTEGKAKDQRAATTWCSDMEKKGNEKLAWAHTTSHSVYHYVTCSPLRPPSAFSTQSFSSASPSGRCRLTWPQNNALHHGQRQLRSLCVWGGEKKAPHLHNHDSDTCRYMLCIQMQTLCFKRSRNIYLFMGSGLWIFIAATPVKPIKVSGNKRDIWRMEGGGVGAN